MYFSKDLRLLLTGIGAMLPSVFFSVLSIGSMVREGGISFEGIFGGGCCLFIFVFGVMMIYEYIRRSRRITHLMKNGTRHTGRIFAHQKELSDEINLVVRYFDEDGNAVQTVVTTEQTKKEDYPIGSDIVFIRDGDDAAYLERAAVPFTEEEHERLANIQSEAARKRAEHLAKKKAKRAASRYTLYDITDRIAPGDPSVRHHIGELMKNPLRYYFDHYDPADTMLDENEDADRIQWICMAWILIENGYAFEADSDMEPEREDFARWICALQGAKKHDLTIDPEALEEEPYIPDWCSGVDEQWKEKGFCLGLIDIDSETYVLFPCTPGELEELSGIASDMEYHICSGSLM